MLLLLLASFAALLSRASAQQGACVDDAQGYVGMLVRRCALLTQANVSSVSPSCSP
jgi:hypothetical protein